MAFNKLHAVLEATSHYLRNEARNCFRTRTRFNQTFNSWKHHDSFICFL